MNSGSQARPEGRRPTRPMAIDPVTGGAGQFAFLVVVHGPSSHGPVVVERERTRIGRDREAGADLVLSDPSVSRVHAVLTRDETGMSVADAGSSNGVFVNGRRVERAALRPGDVLRLGDSLLVVPHAVAPPPSPATPDLGIAGQSAAVVELRATIRMVASSSLPALIEGPTGTGKELVARAMHVESGRAGDFVTINCAALPHTLIESVLFGHKKGAFTGAGGDQDGAFVQADRGTLFLDEVGELPIEAQPKLLRAIETLEVTPLGAAQPIRVDARIVCATNLSLELALRTGRFRDDLYARLAGIVLHTPPLAECREDVLPLWHRFLGPTAAARPMTADFAESLLVWSWPHNVRELRKLAERLEVLHPEDPTWERGMLDAHMQQPPEPAPPPVPPPVPPLVPPPVHPNVQPAPASVPHAGRVEKHPPTRDELLALLEQFEGNVSLVARHVGRNRKQVYRWMQAQGVDRNTGRKP